MKKLVTTDRARVGKWAADKIRPFEPKVSFEGDYALGLEDGGELVAAAVFTNWSPPSITGHIASDGSKKWLTKGFLRAMFDYPFNQLKCKRITAPIAEQNIDAQRFVEKLGFRLEGRLRKAMLDGTDRLIYGMLREECKYA